MRTQRDSLPKRGLTLAALLVLCVAHAGCKSYKPRPLALAQSRDAWLARSPEDESIARFAERLRATDHTSPAFDPSDGVSIAEAETIALVYNADLNVARQRALLCLACVGAAGAWEDPTFSVDLARIVESVDEPWKIGGSIGISVPFSGRLKLDKLHAEAEQASEVMRAVELEWHTRMNLRRAWATWSAHYEQTAIAQSSLARLDAVLLTVERLEQVEQISKSQAAIFRIERAMLAVELNQLQSQVELDAIELRRLMGLAPSAQVAFEPWGTQETYPAALTSRDVHQRVMDRNATLAAKSSDYVAAERLLEWEIRKQYPDIELSPGLGQEDGLDEVRLGFSLKLPVLNRNKRGIAEAQSARNILAAEIEALFQKTATELASAEIVFNAATRDYTQLRETIAPMVDEQAGTVDRLAQLGALDPFVLLDTLTRERQTKLDLITARERVAHAAISLTELAGPELLVLADPQGLATPQMREALAQAGCSCPDCVAEAFKKINRTAR